MLLESDFAGSCAEELDEDDGLLDEDDDGGVLLEVEPAPAEPLVLGLGVELDEDDEEPPLAWSFFCRSIEVDEEVELEGAVELGALVEPELDGVVELDELDEPVEPGVARSVELRLQPTSAVLSAKVTARANVETFMGPPWLGLQILRQQGSGRDC